MEVADPDFPRAGVILQSLWAGPPQLQQLGQFALHGGQEARKREGGQRKPGTTQDMLEGLLTQQPSPPPPPASPSLRIQQNSPNFSSSLFPWGEKGL